MKRSKGCEIATRKNRTKTDQLEPAGRVIDKEKSEASSATWQAGGLVLDGLFGGRKSRSSIVTSATCAFKQRSDVGRQGEADRTGSRACRGSRGA